MVELCIVAEGLDFLVGGFFVPIRFSSSLLTFLLTFSLPPMYSGQFLTSEGNGVEKRR